MDCTQGGAASSGWSPEAAKAAYTTVETLIGNSGMDALLVSQHSNLSQNAAGLLQRRATKQMYQTHLHQTRGALPGMDSQTKFRHG